MSYMFQPRQHSGYGIAALSLGLCGLLLLFWQPLATFLSFCGFLLGAWGCLRALQQGQVGLRSALGGTAVAAAATAINVLIWYGGIAHFTRAY